MGTHGLIENRKPNQTGDDPQDEQITHETKELLLSLPKEKGWRTRHVYNFQGFWCQSKQIQSVLSFQKHFQAEDTDVVLASIPKSGTTWLKALAFAILRRKEFPVWDPHHPLFANNPHDLVPFFEYNLFANNKVPDLSGFPRPRLFGTHVPITWLKDSIFTSKTRIVYICTNPLDTFISTWHYLNTIKPKSAAEVSLEEGFQMYCDGVIGYGPFWDHMLGYWKESLENPKRVLFLKYEDMKGDTFSELKKLAEFLGVPFTDEEVDEGVVEKIAGICSFEKMKEQEVNKNGRAIMDFENRNLFRKAEVGDWVNYLRPSMVKKMLQVLEEKLGGSGLKFNMFT